MAKNIDPGRIAKIEKAIEEKYGKETTTPLEAYWNSEKEKEFLKQQKELYKESFKKSKKSEKIQKDEYFVDSKLIIRKNNSRECFYCKTYSFDKKDDLYMLKFEMCYRCFLKYLEYLPNEIWDKKLEELKNEINQREIKTNS